MAHKKTNLKNNYLYIILVSAILFSCSNNDDGGEAPPVSPLEEAGTFDISVFAKKDDAIFQVDIIGNHEEAQVTNLSESQGLSNHYQQVHINGTKVTFFYLNSGSYAFWQKDVITGGILSRSPVCDLEGEESLHFTKTNGDQIALITLENNGINNWKNYLRVYDPATEGCSRFYINDNYLYSSSGVHLHRDRLYVSTPGEGEIEPSLTIINSNTGEQVHQFLFETDFRTMMNEEQLFILFPNSTYKAYSLNDFSLLTEGSTSSPNIYKPERIYNSTFKGSKMVFDYPYAQPSPLSSSPAIYDWATNEMIHGGDFYMLNVRNELQNESIQFQSFTVARVNLTSNVLAAGYKIYGETEKGGVVYFTFEGEIIKNILLDYVPFEILIR